MRKIKLNSKEEFDKFMSFITPNCYMNWAEEMEPTNYPCILVYAENEIPDSYKNSFEYIFIYNDCFEK